MKTQSSVGAIKWASRERYLPTYVFIV